MSTLTNTRSPTHSAQILINSFLVKRTGPPECEWDSFLIDLSRKVEASVPLDDEAAKRLRMGIADAKKRVSVARVPVASFARWINNGCPE
ncbi:MAG TPA: hypothetical protein VJI33_02685 [Candidatus Paceibacterota bacterium]